MVPVALPKRNSADYRLRPQSSIIGPGAYLRGMNISLERRACMRPMWTSDFNGKSSWARGVSPAEENHDDSVKYGGRSEQVFDGAGKAARGNAGAALMGD